MATTSSLDLTSASGSYSSIGESTVSFPLASTSTESDALPVNDSGVTLTCDSDVYDGFLLTVYPIAAAVVAVLWTLENRAKCCWNQCRRQTCIYPINMLDGYKDRLGYGCIFGTMTVQLIDVLLKGTTISGAIAFLDQDWDYLDLPLLTPFLKVLTLIVNVGLITAAFYPLFLCISTDYRFIGAVLGLACTLYRLGFGLWMAISCQIVGDSYERYTLVKYNTIFYNAPALLCLCGLAAKFIFVMVKCIRKDKLFHYPRPPKIAEKHHDLHVRRLLGATPLPWQEENLHSVSLFNLRKLKAVFLYRRTPYFRYPNRLVATCVILIAATYQVGLMVIFTVWSRIRYLKKEVPKNFRSLVGPTIANILEDYIEDIARWLQIASDLWIAVTVITILATLGYLYHASLCYKKHVYRVYRGDRSMFPTSWVRQSNQKIMTSAVRYAGLQVAYFMWGFVLIQVVLYIAALFFTFGIIVPAAEFGYYDIITFMASLVVIPTLISMAVYYSQVLLARFCFLQPKVKPTDTTVPLAVNNRHMYYNVSLFYFFFNIFLGIVSAIMRILKGMFLGVFFIPRIDRSVMMRGYETMDTGFMCYLSALTVTGAHDHPVVRMFLKLLWDGAESRRNKSYTGPELSRQSRIARRNWQLAYTLINNPDVIRYRKTHTNLEDIDTMAVHRVKVAERKKADGVKTSELYDHAAEYNHDSEYDHESEYEAVEPSRVAMPPGAKQWQPLRHLPPHQEYHPSLYPSIPCDPSTC